MADVGIYQDYSSLSGCRAGAGTVGWQMFCGEQCSLFLLFSIDQLNSQFMSMIGFPMEDSAGSN